MLRVTCGMSRNDIVLLACGSRSMSSVRLPRRASAAAKLMAVVVFPTPPFWLAIATIIRRRENSSAESSRLQRRIGPRAALRSHLVFEVVRIEALEPLVQAIGVGFFGRRIDRLRVVEHRVLD